MPSFLTRFFLGLESLSPRLPRQPRPSAISVLRDHSLILFRHFLRQLDYVASQKIRRTCSLVDLYSRLWERERLRQILERVGRRLFHRHQRFLLLGLSGVIPPSLGSNKSDFDWGSRRLPDEFMSNHKGDVAFAHELTQKTLVCPHCQKRHVIESEEPGVVYCHCSNKRPAVYGVQTEDIQWTPFLERKDIIVWRQPHPNYSGLFIYMLYGTFDDVTPNEFLHVQIDLTEFRLTWDKNSAQCHVLEQDLHEESHSLSQMYYWEVNWPRFFANRDYVCNRRTQIFEPEDVGVIYSKTSSHPAAPKKSKNFRVEDYWSVMTIKPRTGWDDNGVEFSLIAFENPGVSLPSSVTTWVAIRGLPEFMHNLRAACIDLRKHQNPKRMKEGTEEEDEDAVKDDVYPPSIPLPLLLTMAVSDANKNMVNTGSQNNDKEQSPETKKTGTTDDKKKQYVYVKMNL